MKLFLSHSTKDKAFVEKLAAKLRTNGIDQWLCCNGVGYLSVGQRSGARHESGCGWRRGRDSNPR